MNGSASGGSGSARGGSATFFGLVRLAGDIPRSQVAIFVLVAVSLSNMGGLLALMQPYVMTTIAHVAVSRQGVVNANLTNAMLLTTIVSTPLWGILADRVGRKPVMLAALVGQSAALILYPFGTSEPLLYLLRLMFGFAGAAQAVGISTLIIDYPAEESRGRFISIMLAVQSLTYAALIGLLGGRLPLMLIGMGLPEVMATRLAFWIPAALSLSMAAVTLVWFRPPVAAADRSAPRLAPFSELASVLAEARHNLEFRGVLLIAIVVRSDFAVVNTFLALWVANAGVQSGLSAIEATAHAGTLLTIIMFCQVAAGLLSGWLADRLDRRRVVAPMLAFTAAAYAATLLVTDIFSPWGLVIAALIGLAEGASTTVAQAILGQAAPKEFRGASASLFMLLGQLGAMAITFLGGVLYDKAGYQAPFVVVAALNVMVLLYRAVVLRTAAARARAAGLAASANA